MLEKQCWKSNAGKAMLEKLLAYRLRDASARAATVNGRA
jgi:hypothetical protein